MKRILELVNAAKPQSLRKLLEREDGQEKNLLTYRLYKYIRSGKYEEPQIVSLIYGTGKDTSHGAYRTLKTRLSNLLMTVVLEENFTRPTYRTYDEAYENGHRQLEVARILMAKRLYASAREVASQAFRYVKDYENPTLNLGLTDILASLNLGVAYNETLFKKYHALYEHYAEVCQDLNIITAHYRQIRNELYANRLSPVEIGEMASRFATEDTQIRNRNSWVPVLQMMYSQTELTGLMLKGDYVGAIASAETGIDILTKCKGANVNTISMLALSRIDCTIKLKNFALGLRQIEAARIWVPKGTINELKIYEYAIRLGLFTGNYEFAYRHLAEVEDRGLKELLTQRHQEFWTIMTAYVQMLILAGELIIQPDWPEIKRFRLSSFLNNVPANVRNKRGTNIQILILQAVILILQNKFDEVIARTDALSVYCSRYLRDDSNLRNNGFFKLLLNIIQASFNRKVTEKKAAYTLKKMREAEISEQQNDLELIPYETLWKIIIKHLD
ncbi:hypothetical protein [Neolewinella antarctica]|uniref:Pentatricopeptide repeat-containing protein n=1 Tax=Neolewinella antarctica TaxID=442734 RepID=A0ABX0XEI5_9BACT|nr:hypothetical protein [Neolewinella antarctica]NJC27705.1 hypothetical protein [Neolewinella antarctica]